MLAISKEQAREILVHYHGLHEIDSFGKGKEGLLNVLGRIKSIQFDPLNIIGTNMDLVISSRISTYTPENLDDLLYKEKKLVEGFDKELCIYRSNEWNNFSFIRSCMKTNALNKLIYRKQIEALNYIEDIIEIIKSNGPLCSQDIVIGSSGQSKWGSSNISNIVMDYLFLNGQLTIVNRKNKVKYYELTEKLDRSPLIQSMNESNFLKWYIKRRINCIGFYWEKSGAGWQGLYLSNSKIRKKIISDLVSEGELIPFKILTMKETFYIAKEFKYLLNKNDFHYDNRVKMIAPLDNFIWDRKLIASLFDFKYVWEVYKPKESRKYGYYVIPLMYHGDFIGRFEPNKDDLNKSKIWWEEKYKNNIYIHNKVHNFLKELSY